MANPYPEHPSGTSHVRDCQLWAEIDYLDSPTDYREYLPGQEISPGTPDRDDLVMLETQNHSLRRYRKRLSIVLIGVITMLIFVLICGCFFHLFFDAF